MNQSQFPAITCNALDAREKSRAQNAIGFGFASHRLKNWRESFKPITKRSNRNHVITFDSPLKTALLFVLYRLLSRSPIAARNWKVTGSLEVCFSLTQTQHGQKCQIFHSRS